MTHLSSWVEPKLQIIVSSSLEQKLAFEAMEHLFAMFTLDSLAVSFSSTRRGGYCACLVDTPKGTAESEPY